MSAQSVHDNERSYAIELISAINDHLHGKDMHIKRAGGESTINEHGRVKVPDVLLFSDRQRSTILQGWEIKCPDVKIDDEEFVADAHRKADLLGCNSCILWNFQHAELHAKTKGGSFEILESWTISEHITDRASINAFQGEWTAFLHSLVDKIELFIASGKIKQRELGEVITDSIMPKIINENKDAVASALKRRAAVDALVDIDIGSWWRTVAKEYTLDEVDAYRAYAKMLLIGWLNKLLFANLIKIYYQDAREVESITEGCTVEDAARCFALIASRCGFYHIFSSPPYCDSLPDATLSDLVQFNGLLQMCDLEQLDSRYRHRLLEESISSAKRQISGQYPTPEPLAKLMAELGVRNATGHAWDCCCGTGTIGKALWERKMKLTEPVMDDAADRAYRTTWLSDIHDFPLQVATLALSPREHVDSPLLVFQKNAFEIEPGTMVEFIDPSTGEEVGKAVPRFDTIASNLPYVDFNTQEIGRYSQIRNELKQEARAAGIKLHDRNDLYCYFCLYLERLLNDGGVACLLTSNTWLFSQAGVSFFEMLALKYQIEGIFVNGQARWFHKTKVMNALLVLRKKKPGDVTGNVRMGVVHASIGDLDDPAKRSAIVASILSGGDRSALVAQHRYSLEDIRRFRAWGITLYALCFGVSSLSPLTGKLVPIGSLFEVFRGVKSGYDGALYSDDPCFVDPPFCFPLVKNLRGTHSYTLEPNQYVLICDKSKEELAREGYLKTLGHIRRHEAGVTKSAKSNAPYWYSLPAGKSFHFATMMNPGDRLFFAQAGGDTCFANQRLICLRALSDHVDLPLAHALLNSCTGLLMLESSGGPMGDGALDNRKESLAGLSMLDPSLVAAESRQAILDAFEPLKRRAVKPLQEELYEADREAFDKAVLQAFELEDLHNQIRDALSTMVKVRTEGLS